MSDRPGAASTSGGEQAFSARGAAPFALTPAERERVDTVDRLVASGKAGVGDLLRALGDRSWTVRRAVVAALGSMGDDAVPALIETLRDARRDETVIAATVDSLVVSTGDVETALAALAASAVPVVLADVAQILGRRRRPGAAALLMALAEHPADNVAVAAIEALGRVGGRAAVQSLVAAVRSGSFFRAFPAIDVLGRSGDPRAVPALARLLGSSRYGLEAARALGSTGDRGAVGSLAPLLLGPSSSEVRVAAMALAELVDRFGQRHGVTAPVEEALREEADVPEATRRIGQVLPDASASERSAAAVVLGMLRDPAGVELLTGMLGDADERVASAAARALRQVGRRFEDNLVELVRTGDAARRKLLFPLLRQRASAATVAPYLGDEDPELRVAACEALARLGDPTPVPALYGLLEDANPGVVQAAVAAIQALGSRESEPLAIAAARSASPQARRWALRIMSYFGFASAVDACLAGLGDADHRVRESAAAGLALLDEPRAREALLGSARADDPRTRAAAARALGTTAVGSDARVQSALLKLLDDGDAWTRYYACQALGRLGAVVATDRIAGLLRDPAGQVAVAAVEALSHLSSPGATQALLAVAGAADIDPDMRRAALIGLGIGHPPEALPTLLDALEDAASDAATRLVALAALAAYPDDAATHALAAAARSADDSLRNAAVRFLAGREGAAASELLVELARQRPREELGRTLGDALAMPSDARIAAVVKALATADDELAAVLTSALGRMARPEATAALLDIMRRPQVAARKAAAVSLAGVGTRAAEAALQAAAVGDPDLEVRRICALLLR
jgi:HEAT repeat protein